MIMQRIIRYAVVGLGYIAQNAVLPAFRNTKRSLLTALISGDEKKLKVLGRKYRVRNLFSYEDYDQALRSGLFDAVYIALPNDMHAEYTIRAANAGIAVLCEKPMAVNSKECLEMISTCEKNHMPLMIAYRLHFEKTNLTAIQMACDKKTLGDLRFFQSMHSQLSVNHNIRTLPIARGGGPTFDIGVYDINAARYLFRDEPISVSAQSANGGNPAFKSIEESMSVILRFPGERLASIVYSFGAVETDTYRIAGTKGELSVDPAYTYHGSKTLRYSHAGGASRSRVFKARDQFSPEIDYFSKCVIENKVIEPSGWEGFADIRIIEAILKSAQTGEQVGLPEFTRRDRPELFLEKARPPVPPVEVERVYHSRAPSKKKAA